MMNKRTHSFREGQAMILITIITGFIILSATVIAGFLMHMELRQSNDAITSGMAVFATDAGLEDALRCYYLGTNVFGIEGASSAGCGTLENGSIKNIAGSLGNRASYKANLWCVGADRLTQVDCTKNDLVYGLRIRSFGVADRTERLLETFYLVRY
jgi:hypothetical protein